MRYSKQQQTTILKGVANQLLSLQQPTFMEAELLLKEFDFFANSNANLKYMVLVFGNMNLPETNHEWQNIVFQNPSKQIEGRFQLCLNKEQAYALSQSVLRLEHESTEILKTSDAPSFIIAYATRNLRVEIHHYPNKLIK